MISPRAGTWPLTTSDFGLRLRFGLGRTSCRRLGRRLRPRCNGLAHGVDLAVHHATPGGRGRAGEEPGDLHTLLMKWEGLRYAQVVLNMVLSTYNHIYRMYNPIEITSYNH